MKKINEYGFSALIIVLVVFCISFVGLVGWYVWDKNDMRKESATTTSQSKSVQQTKNVPRCAYMPTENYKENEGLYNFSHKAAKSINFDVYLPCSYHKKFRLAELGISSGDDNEVPNVFIRFDRLDDTLKDNLPNSESFDIVALPAQHQPPECVDNPNDLTRLTACHKVADSKFGPVYASNNELAALFFTINNSLVRWDAYYEATSNIKPLIDIINSFEKVDPNKLEFFNG